MSKPCACIYKRGPLAEVVIDRPERHNALVPELLEALRDALAEAAADPGLRVLLLRSIGRSFSTGGDVQRFADERDRIGDYSRHLVGLLNECILAIHDMPCPVVCMVQGLVTGGALGLMLAADVVIMDEAASITPWYAEVGFSPDGGWTALLPERIGAGRAAEILLSNRTMTAREAAELGLAHRLVPLEVLGQVSLSTAERISRLRAGAIAASRSLLKVSRQELARRLEAEREAFVAQIQTAEAADGIRAYLARKP